MESYGIMHLLEDRGYQQEAQWIKDGYSEEKGCVPYSKYTAGWKALYAFLGKDDPPQYFGYRFKGDIKQADRAWVLDQLHNGHLKEWLAIFFHENPRRDFSKQYYYESEVERYLEFIRELDPHDENVVRLDAARNSVMSESKKLGNWKLGIIFTQAVCGLLFAIPALLFIGWMIFHGLPIDGNPLTNSVGLGFLVIGCLVGGLLYTLAGRDEYEFSGCGCLIAGIVGAFLFALIFYLMVRYIGFVLPALPWIPFS